MINHARTLLLNVAGAGSSRDDIGEEYIPPDFVPVRLPTYLQTPRKTLFGAAPDRYFLNFRARELMQLLHQTELAEFVYALDPRVTYWPDDSVEFFGPASKISFVAAHANSTAQLFFTGNDAADLSSGKSLREYTVKIAGSDVVITALRSQAVTITPLTLDSGLSQEIQLPQSPLRIRVLNAANDDTWTVRTLARPEPVVTALLPVLELLGEPVFLELFGVSPVEPYATFKNMWFDHPNAVYRLGGLLLAIIYRTSDVRKQTNGAN